MITSLEMTYWFVFKRLSKSKDQLKLQYHYILLHLLFFQASALERVALVLLLTDFYVHCLKNTMIQHQMLTVQSTFQWNF